MSALVRCLRALAADLCVELAAERERRDRRNAYLTSVEQARYRRPAA